MTTFNGADAMVRMLQLNGVKHIFGLCGDTSLPFYDALARLDHGMDHILTRDERSAALRYLPDESRGTAHGDTITTASTVAAAPLVPPADIPIVQPASEAERMAPPAPGPDVVPAVPAPVVQHLANGFTVITVPSHAVPLVSAMLVAPGGSADDPDGRA